MAYSHWALRAARPAGAVSLLLAAFLSAAQNAPPARLATDASATTAVWKEQTLTFHYFGRTSRYTCDGLEDKLRALMLDVGVWKEPQLTTSGCAYGRLELAVLPIVRVKFYSLVPATAAAGSVPVLTSPRAQAEVNRSRNQHTPPNTDSTVVAQYRPFNFERDSFRNLEEGDCELIEEFSRQLLPKLSTRQLDVRTRCVPYQISLGSYRVRGEVLKPLNAAPSAGAQR